VTLAIVLVIAYFLGAIPTSYLVVHRLTGQDIRNMGNGNPGMMNVLDHVGTAAAIVVGVGDVGKGMAAVTIALVTDVHEAAPMLAGLVAIIGHDYSIFLMLDGGNGMATAVGGIAALAPLAVAPAVVVALAIVLIAGSRRLAGIISLLLVPAFAYIGSLEPAAISGVVLLMTLTALKIISFEGFTQARTRIDR
jgi:glycerol-3-phosphate acyltransferase PlsY